MLRSVVPLESGADASLGRSGRQNPVVTPPVDCCVSRPRGAVLRRCPGAPLAQAYGAGFLMMQPAFERPTPRGTPSLVPLRLLLDDPAVISYLEELGAQDDSDTEGSPPPG